MAAVCLTGCVSDRIDRRAPALPLSFQNGSSADPSGARSSGTALLPPADRSLYAAFGSADLVALIAAADQDNPDLAAAVSRVEQADALARQAGAPLLPEVTADLGATRFDGRSHSASARETDWSALLAASYEMDFWGKNRAAQRSARATAEAARADRQTVRITITTDVAAAYFKIQSLREQIALAQSNLRTASDLSKFIELRYAVGLLGPTDLAAQRSAVATAQLAIPPLQQQEVAMVSSLAALLGRIPEGFDIRSRPMTSFIEPAIAAGLPAELLRRRPDLVAAEYDLQAAHADLQEARAALYPSLSLTASGGVANPAVQAAVITLAGTGLSLTAGVDLVQTVFDNGRRRAATQVAAAHEQELLARYRGTLVGALVDVENALAMIAHLDAQQHAENEALAQSQRAFEGTQLRYRAGSIDYVAVLEAQQVLYTTRTQYSDYALARFQALLGLNKALGGGWIPSTASTP